MTTNPPPNFVFLFPDQLRRDYLSYAGCRAIETPNIDKIAQGATIYEDAISSSPLCVPARSALLTGVSAPKLGTLDTLRFLRPDLAELGMATWPELLGRRGYETAAIGKMHFYPWDASMGFERRVVAEDKTWVHIQDDYADALAEHGERKRPGSELPTTGSNRLATTTHLPRHLTVDGFVGDQACQFIRERDDNRPFAMMVGFPGPHDPYDPRPEYLDRVDTSALPPVLPDPGGFRGLQSATSARYSEHVNWGASDYSSLTPEETTVVRTHYAALVAQIDDEIGRILTQLEAEGLSENTYIILASDHGDQLGDHGFPIGKNHFFEPSVRVPLIVHAPGQTASVRSSAIVDLRDITATILELAGCEVPSYCDSVPLPDVAGLSYSEGYQPRTQLFGVTANGMMAYDGRWKLHAYTTGERGLFDLEDDPDEQHNLIGSPTHVDKQLALEAIITAECIEAFQFASTDRRAWHGVDPMVSNDIPFGQRGWKRPYPMPHE